MNKFCLAAIGGIVFSSVVLAAAPAPTYAPTKPSGPCFWQVPGEQRWVNLDMVRSMKVVARPYSGSKATYEFVMSFESRERPIEIELPPGADTGDLPRSVMKRAQECARGE